MEKKRLMSNSFNNQRGSKLCNGTVYHSSTVKRPQNICPICGKSFLFQMQLRVHLAETHDDNEEEEEESRAENGYEIQMETDTIFDRKELYKDHSQLVETDMGYLGETNIEQINELKSNAIESGVQEDMPNHNTVESENGVMPGGDHVTSGTVLEGDTIEDYEIFINEISDSDESEMDQVENGDENDLKTDTNVEFNKNEVVENNVNLEEVFKKINKREEKLNAKANMDANETKTQSLAEPETQVIVLNKDMNLSRKPDASKLRFECELCDAKFQWQNQLKKHINMHNGLYPYQCEDCGKQFDRSSSLRDHAMVHSKEQPFECDICHVKFTLKNNLSKHMNRHTKDRVWQCEHCRKPFLQRDQLMAHLIIHKGVKPWPCKICGKSFARKTNMKDHMITHSTERNYPCDICHKTFNKPYSRKVHMRNHLDQKPHKCTVCSKSFSQSCALVSHLRLHTGERPFACHLCPKAFAQQSSLQSHVVIHTGERKYKCGMCEKSFTRKHCLTTHIRSHTKERPFQCMLCDFALMSRIGLKKHVETHVKQLIRNADIDLSGLVDLPQLENGGGNDQGPFLVKAPNKNGLKAGLDELNESDNAVNEAVSDNVGNDSVNKSDNGGNERDANKAHIAKSDEESSVYLAGLDMLVSEIKKHCKGDFDPKLLDKGFVTNIINQSSILLQNVDKTIKEQTRFECEVCKMVVPHRKLLTDHLKTHLPNAEDLKKHICDICNKRYTHRHSLLLHQRSHTGERPYGCDHCTSSFKSPRALKLHNENKHKGVTFVESAEQHATALAENLGIDNADPQTVGSVRPFERKKKAKTVTKSKVREKNDGKLTKKDLSDDVMPKSTQKSDTIIENGAEMDVSETVDNITKHAELAAKSICNTLFSGKIQSKTLHKGSSMRKSQTFNKKTKQFTSQTDLRKEKSKLVPDSHTLLRQALVSSKPLAHSCSMTKMKTKVEIKSEPIDSNESTLIPDVGSHSAESSASPIQLDSSVLKTENMLTSLSKNNVNFPKGKNCKARNINYSAQTQVVSNYSSQGLKGTTIQNEYETLRMSLQKSLNSKPLTQSNSPVKTKTHITIKSEPTDSSENSSVLDSGSHSAELRANSFLVDSPLSRTKVMLTKNDINFARERNRQDRKIYSSAQKPVYSSCSSQDLKGMTIQNEYETLRMSLQNSLNSVMIAPLLDD